MMDHRSIVADTRQANVASNGHTHQEPQRVARAIVEDLLSEQPTYGFSLEQAGPYAHGLRILQRVRQRNGREPARRTLSDLQTNEALFRDLLADPPLLSAETRSDYPELPAHVKANQSLSKSASPLLDALITFFQEWCTRSYEGYHEAVAIWVLATIAARRVVLRWRTGVWTILYLLLVSESTAHAKTEAASYGALVLEQAGLDHLLNPGDFSPQKLLLNMAGTRLPRNYSCMTEEQREAVRRKMAFSAQRGWVCDEFGNKLQDIIHAKGGYNAVLYSLLKQLYDCKKTHEYDTVSHDTVHIDMPSLSLLGTATPACLKPIAGETSAVWSDGLFARLSFIVPPKGAYALQSAPKGTAHVPQHLIAALQEWHERLGIPDCTIVDLEEEEELLDEMLGKEGKKNRRDGGQPYRIDRDPLPQQEVSLADEVYEAYDLYYQTLVKLAMEHRLDERFKSTYGRLPEKALRIAMLLASLEGRKQEHPVVQMCHWARGQEITEHWRGDFHELVAQLSSGSAEGYGELETKVLAAIAKLGRMANCREISQAGSTALRKVGSPKVRDICEELAAAGVIERTGQGRSACYGPKGGVR